MNWQVIRLVYQAKSPISIGYHKLGFIQRTRYYIPGRVMWGAITAGFARVVKSKGATAKDYSEFGEGLFKKIILPGYFFPAIDLSCPLIPHYTPDGLKLGLPGHKLALSLAQFERKLVSSITQTAISPECLGAEKDTLHETEFLLDHTRPFESDAPQKLFFVGHLYLRSDAFITMEGRRLTLGWESGDIPIYPILKHLVVGGETKYGSGRLLLTDCPTPALDDKSCDIFGHRWKLDGEFPQVMLKAGDPFAAHVGTEAGRKHIYGDIEPMVGREWDNSKHSPAGPGRSHSAAVLCWTPGSYFAPESPKEERNLYLGAHGIWQ